MVQGMVSCVIPTYRRESELIRALNSVLRQTYRNFEVVVVDDNETDDNFSTFVRKAVLNASDERVRLLRMPEHKNGAAARNYGISQCKGEFLSFLDDDDEWSEDKLEKQVNYLADHKDADAVSCLYRICKNGEIVRKAPVYDGEDLFLRVLNRSVAICTPSVLIRKASLGDSIRFDEKLKRHQDIQFFAAYLKNNKMEVLQEYLVTIHADSVVNKPTANTIVAVKEEFFVSVNDLLSSLTKAEKRTVFAAHYFEVVLVAIREKRFGLAIKYLSKVGINPSAYMALFRRMGERKHS